MDIVSIDIEWIKCIIVACTTWLMVGNKRESGWLSLLGDNNPSNVQKDINKCIHVLCYPNISSQALSLCFSVSSTFFRFLPFFPGTKWKKPLSSSFFHASQKK